MPLYKQIQHAQPCDPTLNSCSEVLLCLTEEWRSRTKCGLALAKAKIVGVGYRCATGQSCCPNLPSGNSLYSKAPTSGDFECVYTIEIDTEAEFLIDPATIPLDQPYDITDTDVLSMSPYACQFTELINSIKTRPDWVVDSANVNPIINAATNTYIVNIPIIDRINGTNQGNFSLDLSVLFDYIEPGTDSLSAYGVPVANGHRHTAVDGTPQDILLISQTAGNVLTYDNGLYLNCAAIAACVTPGGATYTAGCGIDIVNDEISVDTSGTWGSGDLDFPCADTQGQSIYCDSNGQLRTAPPVQAFEVAGFTSGAGNNPAPVVIDVVNPSTCREARVTGGYTGAFNYFAPGASAGGPLLNLALNGNPSVTIAQMIGSSVGGSDIGGTYLSTDFMDANGVIAPGATMTYTIDYEVLPNGGSISSYSVSLRMTVIVI